jgi:O-antigen/teichoic acid export membrane protein
MTHSAANVTKNAIVLTALRIATPAVSMIVVLAISRLVGSEGLGQYTLATTYLNFLITVTPFGLNALLMREGARDTAGLPGLFANAITLSTMLSLASIPVMWVLARVLGYDAATVRVLDVVSLAILPASLLVICEGVFVSRQRSLYVGLYTVVDVFVRVGIASLLLKAGYGITAVVGALVAAQVMSLGAAAYLLHSIGVPVRFAVNKATMKRLLIVAPTFMSITVFATLYWRVDVLMLSTLASIREVGMYGAAYRIMDLIRILPQSLCMAVYPLVSEAAMTDLGRLRRVGSETLRFLLAMTLPMIVGGTMLAGPILEFTVGKEFREAGTTLAVLLWTAIPYTFVRYYAYVIVSANRERIDLLLNVVLSGVNVGLNVLLIPRFGALGSAFATLLSICLFALGQHLYLIRYRPGHISPLPKMGRPLLAVTLMAAFVWWRRGDPILLLVGAAGIVYISVLFLTGFVSRRELGLLVRGEVASVVVPGLASVESAAPSGTSSTTRAVIRKPGLAVE